MNESYIPWHRFEDYYPVEYCAVWAIPENIMVDLEGENRYPGWEDNVRSTAVACEYSLGKFLTFCYTYTNYSIVYISNHS